MTPHLKETGPQMAGIFNGFDIIGGGLRAEMQRAEVIAVNLSHLQDVGNKNDEPYRRRAVVFEEVLQKTRSETLMNGVRGADGLMNGVRVGEVVVDRSPLQPRHDPSHPKADANGFVLMTNVDMFREMVDLRAVQRSFQANLAALRTYRGMIQSAVQNIGR
ncbi:MAG: flagellar basal body rod protein FlgC [Planctomycetes bacterium]|nr:flagellar basal body rod protein FlgC [Planctomycetota bacterium]MCB9872234.1 flagellar basal body rod protein FlgC [Planctomycetota bacterium]MCB9888058.1 flagellar basal body rod protein FlgC [Planctomycetota bacterium]